MTAERVTNLYDLMDSAYDVPEIGWHSYLLGHVPIIDINPRDKDYKEELAREAGAQSRIGYPRRPAARYRDLQAQGRTHTACPQGHPRRASATGNLSRARDRSRSRRHQENDRLTPKRAKETGM